MRSVWLVFVWQSLKESKHAVWNNCDIRGKGNDNGDYNASGSIPFGSSFWSIALDSFFWSSLLLHHGGISWWSHGNWCLSMVTTPRPSGDRSTINTRPHPEQALDDTSWCTMYSGQEQNEIQTPSHYTSFAMFGIGLIINVTIWKQALMMCTGLLCVETKHDTVLWPPNNISCLCAGLGMSLWGPYVSFNRADAELHWTLIIPDSKLIELQREAALQRQENAIYLPCTER